MADHSDPAAVEKATRPPRAEMQLVKLSAALPEMRADTEKVVLFFHYFNESCDQQEIDRLFIQSFFQVHGAFLDAPAAS